MHKKFLASIFSVLLVFAQAIPASASDSIRYKSTEIQVIPKGKWTTLRFNGGKTEIQGNGKRSLFCYQAGIDTKGKKSPSYIKLRITRIVPGPNDPSATNTYFFTEKPGSEFVASNSLVRNCTFDANITAAGVATTKAADKIITNIFVYLFVSHSICLNRKMG